MYRKITAVFLILLVVFSLASCSKVTQQPNNEIVVENEKPESGGTIYLGSIEPQTPNPLLSTSQTYLEVAKLVFESLFDYDEKLELKPVLADSYAFVDGTAKCTVKLKGNVYWSDGEKVTADDVKFSMDTIKAAKDSAFKQNLEHIFSYRVTDSSTIEIVFDQPYANAVDALSFPIIPAHVYSKDINAAPVGSGHFMVSKYEKLKNMELVVNPKWVSKGGQPDSKPYIDKITVVFINDLDAFSTAFQSKEMDVLNTSSYDWEKYNEMKDVKSYKYVSMYYDFIGLNFNNPIFQDKAVRKAIMQGINRQGIIDKYLLGNAVIADVPINPTSWLYDGKNTKYAYSKTEAQNTLAAAGFTDKNGDKILERELNGQQQVLKFTLLTNEENEFRKKAAEEIKKNLADIGIAVEIKLAPFDEMKASMTSHQFDAVLTGYYLSYNQDLSFAFHSTQIPSGKNFTSYANPELDNLLQQAYVTLDNGSRKETYGKIQDVLREEVPNVSLFFRDAAIVVREKVRGDVKPDVVNPYRNIEAWYIPKSRQ